jgi:ActR/RegA family two-component response regulator|nr:MAG TPA: Pilus assembly protein TadZ N-terminal [Caudoviricetes sp.]
MNDNILIIENEYSSVKIAFDTANTLCFDDKLHFKNISKAQQLTGLDINSYSVIFVDISLATNSTLDGFGIIEQFRLHHPDLMNRIVIITGNNKIKDAIKEHKLDSYNLTVLIKPVGFQEIEKTLKSKGVI